MQIRSDCRVFQLLPDFLDSSRFFQIPTGFLRFFQTFSEFLRFFRSRNFSQIPSNSSIFLQMLSDSFIFFLILSFRFFRFFFYSFGCFSILPICFQSNFLRFYQTPSGILKILSNFPVLFRSFQILSDACRFFQILPNFSSFFF